MSEFSQEVKKAVYTFEEAPEGGWPKTFAFAHNLGTTELHVSVRKANGKASFDFESVSQDGNLILVTATYGWNEGDKIIVMG